MRKKRWVSLMMSMVLALGLTACASSSKEPQEPEAAQDTAVTEEAAAEDGEKETYRIVYLSKELSNPLMRAFGNGMIQAKDAYNQEAGYEKIIYEEQTCTNASDVNSMIELCNTLLTQDLDALIITPVSSTSVADVVKRCNERGVAFVNLDTRIDTDELEAAGASTDVFVGFDLIDHGYTMMNALTEGSGGTCKYIVIGGYEGAASNEEMMAGLEKAESEAPDTMERIDYQPADWNRNKAFEVAGNLLTAHPDVEAFICLNDEMAGGTIQAIESIGKVPGKDIKVYGRNFMGGSPELIEEGKQEFSISGLPNTVGGISMEQAIRLCEGKPVEHELLVDGVIEIPGRGLRHGEFTIGDDGKYYDMDGNEIVT